MIFRIILSIAGFLLVAEGIVAASISNLNLGIVMPFVIGIPLIVVGVFYNSGRNFYLKNTCED